MITTGDYIAGGMFGLALAGIIVREWRANGTAKEKAAADKASLSGLVDGFSKQIAALFGQFHDLDERRQKHEVECARVQERTAAIQQQTLSTLERYGRDIGQLQAQVSHVASGAAGRAYEIKAEPSP